MREILFRGKRICDGEWVYGFLIALSNAVCTIIPKNAEQWDGTEYNIAFAVIPETVGQYTGLHDKCGRQIFEGDIACAWYGPNYIVSMDESRKGWYPFACGDGCGCCEYEVKPPEHCVIIGNVHDNPELIKSARDGSV